MGNCANQSKSRKQLQKQQKNSITNILNQLDQNQKQHNQHNQQEQKNTQQSKNNIKAFLNISTWESEIMDVDEEAEENLQYKEQMIEKQTQREDQMIKELMEYRSNPKLMKIHTSSLIVNRNKIGMGKSDNQQRQKIQIRINRVNSVKKQKLILTKEDNLPRFDNSCNLLRNKY